MRKAIILAGLSLFALVSSAAFADGTPRTELIKKTLRASDNVATGVSRQVDPTPTRLGEVDAVPNPVLGTPATIRSHSAADAERLKLQLQKTEASQNQMATQTEDARVIASAETKKPFEDAPLYAKDYGGQPNDYVKLSSKRTDLRDGTSMETHWVEHKKSGERISMKSVIAEAAGSD